MTLRLMEWPPQIALADLCPDLSDQCFEQYTQGPRLSSDQSPVNPDCRESILSLRIRVPNMQEILPMTLARDSSALRVLFLCSALFASTVPAHSVDSGGSNSATNVSQPGYAEGKAAADAGRYQKAISILSEVVKAEANNADAWNLLGYSSRKLKKYENAAKYYNYALQLDPNHLGALEYQGELFIDLGAVDNAKANLARLRSLCGNCEEYSDLKAALTAAGQS